MAEGFSGVKPRSIGMTFRHSADSNRNSVSARRARDRGIALLGPSVGEYMNGEVFTIAPEELRSGRMATRTFGGANLDRFHRNGDT